MKARSMILALAACAACSIAFGTAAAEASTPQLGLAPAPHGNAVRTAAKPKPKIYELCLEIFAPSCYPMEVYKKAGTWNDPSICWVGEEGCVAPFDGTFIKGLKGEVTYLINGPYGEPDAGEMVVYKVKKTKPPIYFGGLYLFGGYDGTAEIIT